MPQPVLRTSRMLLVPLADRHLEWEVELDSDPEVLRYLFGRARPRDEVERAHAVRMSEGRMVDGLGFWAAFLGSTESDEFVGLMMLPPAFDPAKQPLPGTAELGYRLRRRFWRQGLASEASRELLRYAFDNAGQERVIAQTMAVNAGSRAVMTAVGMRYVRTFTMPWDEPLDGAEEGEVEYEITRADWKSGLCTGHAGRRAPDEME